MALIVLSGDAARAADFAEGDRPEVHGDDGELRLVPAITNATDPMSSPHGDLYDYFAPGRAAILAGGVTVDEINAGIDAAIAEVRAEAGARSG